MSYRDEMLTYLNPKTGLVGITPNQADYSSGNPLVETGTAYMLLKKLDFISGFNQDDLNKAFFSCLGTDGKFFSKNPGTDDKASHDDVIGIVAGYSACGGVCLKYMKDDVIEYGQDHHWLLSTTGKFYWDALTKPWHYAFYLLAGGLRPNMLSEAALALFILFDALFNKDSTSDKKLIWMMTETVKGKSELIDMVAGFWRKRLVKVFGSMKNVFKIYYGENHLFTKYCQE